MSCRNTESAPPSDSSRRSITGSVMILEDAEEDPPVVQSELLTYVVNYYQRNSADTIKNTVLAFYTAEEIVNAKTTIWHTFKNCLPPERRRDTTDKRSANEDNLSDIIGTVSDLDAKESVEWQILCDEVGQTAKIRARRDQSYVHYGSDEGCGAAVE